MMVGFWIGTLLVCLSPAARDRALLDHVSIWETCLALASQLKAFYILFFLLGGMLLYEKNTIHTSLENLSMTINSIFT